MGNAERQWGEKVVLLYDGAKAMGVRHLAEALVPGSSSSSSLKREVCKISWDDTSIEPHVAGEIVHFIDSNDVTQVSIVVLLNKVPASMCAHVNRQLFEVLWASAPVHSPAFTLIVPAITSVPLSALEKEGQDNDVAICKAVLYGASEVHKGVYSGLPRLAPTFPLRDGFLAYLMQFVHISSLPTLLILGSSKADASEVIRLLGDIVAQQVGLTYVNKEISNYVDLPDPASGVEVDWRRLYI
ncbi:unnamed protein product [Sphagnum troendelagicum]|uniref:DUF7894 domain-containing protein n=1 Tax=Sphagnum troendelagicum TaxID=128251 RepID=A0ABP0URV6_9BRYO